MYHFIRRVLFWFDAEKVHYFSMNALRLFCRIPFVYEMMANLFCKKIQNRSIQFCGLTFRNCIGLGAGFDKNAKYLKELEMMGFGFVEIGTVTPLAQDGNPKPRLFRLAKDKALINRMGFNNDGVAAVAQRLKIWQSHQSPYQNIFPKTPKLIIGGNIGKNKMTPNENAWQDYEICFNALFDFVDYFVINVSSPNTPGLRELQEKESLRKIITHLQKINITKQNPKPILLKIAPDLSFGQLDDIVSLAIEINLDGLVVSNTSIDRSTVKNTKPHVLDAIGAGGLSGLPVKLRNTEILQYIHEKTEGKIAVIASGGIFTAEDVKEKKAAGASLFQVWTGFIYQGPMIVKNIVSEV